jgi:hypothetical protein
MSPKSLFFVFLGLMLLGVTLVTATALAAAPSDQTFTVNTIVDGVDALPNGVCETAPNNGVCTLRAAIMESNAQSDPNTIILPVGMFQLALPGGNEEFSLSGDLDIRGTVTISGANRDQSIVDGSSLDRVLDIHYGTVTISGVTIQHGTSDSGGGIRNNGTLDLIASKISYNTVTGTGSGGGISNSGTLTLIESQVNKNIAPGYGGGINSAGTLTVQRSTISENQGASYSGGFHGGGLHITGPATINASLIYGNIAGDGNGGGIDRNGTASVYITNSTISGNRTDGRGGGIHIGGGPVYMNNVTVTNNTANNDIDTMGGGGGVVNNGTLTLENTIIAGNRDKSFALPNTNKPHDCAGTVTSKGYNLIGINTGCSGFGNNDYVGTASQPLDAKLDGLGLWGGPTSMHGLKSDSPAIDAGNPNGCKDANGNTLATDQRGYVRPAGAACDIGAFEYNATAPTPPPCAAKPAKPQIEKPIQNASLKGKRAKLNWNDVSCTDSYQIRVRRDAKKGPSVEKQNELAESKYKTKSLDRGHTYYWRAIACNQYGCAKSGWRKFSIQP